MKNFIFISPHFPSSYWRFCDALKERGFNVLGIGDAPYNEVSEECKNALTEYYLCVDMDKFENEKKAVEYYKEKYGDIDYLESNNEYWLEKDAMLREIFDVANGPRPTEINRYKFKSVQKEFYEKAGLKTARYCLTHNDDEVIEFSKKVGFPIFAKPDNGVGAQDTHKFKNIEDLQGFLQNRDRNVTYIIEEYVDGMIVSFDGITDSHADVIFYTNNVFINDNAEIVANQLDDLYYCIPGEKVDPVLVDMGKRALKAMEVKNRFFHLEFFVLKSDHPYLGKKGTIVPLEANLRPAGGYTPDLINFANSTNCYEIYADSIAYDENRQYNHPEKFYAGAPSRRNAYNYAHSLDEVFEKYREHICFYGDYPKVLRDDMGDSFVMAKFKTLDELFDFDKFYREKK